MVNKKKEGSMSNQDLQLAFESIDREEKVVTHFQGFLIDEDIERIREDLKHSDEWKTI